MKLYKIDQYFEFHFNTQRFDTGAATDADATPTWRSYEENNDTVIANSDCAKRDDANTTGYYYARGQITAAAGYEVGKTYEVRAAATVNSVAGAGVIGTFAVIPALVWDSLFGGTDNLQVDSILVNGSTPQTAADIAAAVLVLTTGLSTVSDGAVSDSDVVFYQHAALKAPTAAAATWTIVDSNGTAVSLSGKDLVFQCWDYTSTTVLWHYHTGTANLSVGGTSSNVVSLTADHTNTATAGTYRYTIINTTDDVVIARGKLTVVEERAASS